MSGATPVAHHSDTLARLRLHVEAVWDVRLPPLSPGDVGLLPGGSRPPWAHYLAMTAAGQVRIWRPDVPEGQHAALAAQAFGALGRGPDVSAGPGITREVALQLSASPTVDLATAGRVARRIASNERALIETFEPGSGAVYFAAEKRRPVYGVVVGGRLVSMAHSSRRTAQACELGIATRPVARRRGYALAATVCWTQAVLEEGLIPIYSALAENAASLSLAAAAGYRPFARAAYVVL